jgi:hypothetical protein
MCLMSEANVDAGIAAADDHDIEFFHVHRLLPSPEDANRQTIIC